MLQSSVPGSSGGATGGCDFNDSVMPMSRALVEGLQFRFFCRDMLPVLCTLTPAQRGALRKLFGGHPYLVRRALFLIATERWSLEPSITAEEIADAAVGAAEAGAAVVHLHARDPIDGRPDQSPEAFEPFLRVIKQRSDVVVNLTTGGSPYMTVEERVRPAATACSTTWPT
jgi:hypothetical protein